MWSDPEWGLLINMVLVFRQSRFCQDVDDVDDVDDDDVDDVDDSGNACRGNERIKARQNERRRRKWNDEVEQLPRVVNPVVGRLSRTLTSTNALGTNAPPRINTHHQPKHHWEQCTTYAPIIKTVAVWTLNNFKPPCKTRAPRVSWLSYWLCGPSITFAFNLRSLDGCPHIFVHGHVWLQQHCLTTDRHLPCILFSISMQYSNIPCSKSHPSQSTKYQMSPPSSPRVRMFCALKKNLQPGHFSKRKS